MKIAIYGKGGIGKSTISSNLAAALAAQGRRTLLVGCDPKRDSTRLLGCGRDIVPVLDYLRSKGAGEHRLAEVVHGTAFGVDCLEAGGPRPGVGCAGRGILSTFDLLRTLGLSWSAYDDVIFDVLGDVVCGGFAVPLRSDISDAIAIVTSGEPMALYAANNILRGVAAFEAGGPRVAGLIFNSRGLNDEVSRVERFAEAVELPIIARFPRSEHIRRADAARSPVEYVYPGSLEAELFQALARHLVEPNPALFGASALSDADFEGLVEPGRSVCSKPMPPTSAPKPPIRSKPGFANGAPRDEWRAQALYPSKALLRREPLHGCALAGAVNITTQVIDASTVIHGPTSCAHIAERTLWAAGNAATFAGESASSPLVDPGLLTSEMGERAMVFGGRDELRASLHRAKRGRPGAVFAVSTCPAGLIGDDLQEACRAASQSETPAIPIRTDGNLTGDYLQGLIAASIALAQHLIDPRVPRRDDTVNIIAEKNIATNTEKNYRQVSSWLQSLGLRVGVRFVRRAEVNRIRRFTEARLNILASDDHLGRTLQSYFERELGARFAPRAFPVGLEATSRFLTEIGAKTERSREAAQLVGVLKDRLEPHFCAYRKALGGKKLMILTYNHDIDWILEAALKAEMDVVKVGILSFSQDDLLRTRYGDAIDFEVDYPPARRNEDAAALGPDLLVSNYAARDVPRGIRADAIPLSPDVGPGASLQLLERWRRILAAPASPGWKDDAR